MTHITCRLTAKNRDQLRNSTLGNRVYAAFALLYLHCCQAERELSEVSMQMDDLSERLVEADSISTAQVSQSVNALPSYLD